MIFNISKTQTTLIILRFMDKLVIRGGNPLQGDVKISGAKNAVLPIMASSLLVDGITVIRNVPDLRDTKTFIKLLEILGAKCVLDGSTLSVDASDINLARSPLRFG